MARQTGPEWEAFYASFSNESLAPSGIKPGDDGAPVPPPKPASVAQTGDGFDEEADFDETMGREGGGGGGGTMEDDREFVRSKTLSPTNVAPRKVRSFVCITPRCTFGRNMLSKDKGSIGFADGSFGWIEQIDSFGA